jgi:GMP synthase (glutamine-hydrolysing)
MAHPRKFKSRCIRLFLYLARVLAVNNYPTTERFERLRKSLAENGAEVTSTDWAETGASRFNEFDGVALSGAPDMMSEEDTQKKFRAEVDAIRDAQVPVLGVCFGHQLMAHAFGSVVVKDKEHVLRFVKTTALVRDPLFSGLPREMMLLESRDEVLQALPAGFQLLARSETSPIAAMKHDRRPLYGVQFHPERFTPDNSAGNRVIGNFVKLLI